MSPGAGYSLNVMKAAKKFNKELDFTALQVSGDKI